MNEEKALSLLGLARRAGKLSLGHDAAIGSVVRNNAKLCLVASDASERLKKEFSHACSYGGKNICLIEIKADMLTLSKAVGSKAAVMTVDDEGFGNKIRSLLE